jgi:hypothetical protein
VAVRRTLLEAAEEGRLDELHQQLLAATVDHDDAPAEVLVDVAARLRRIDIEKAGLAPRALVVMRLLAAGAVDAAWLVVRDNAVGVVEESFGASTSSGARRATRRFPFIARPEPPDVYAWLPGLHDPRLAAPESAYDITTLVTARVRLDEMWWHGRVLVLGGMGYLRYLATAPDDAVEVALTHTDGRTYVVDGERVRRPDLVRGTGGDLTRLAWAGWTARVTPPGPGIWRVTLRLTEGGITRDAALGGAVGEAVPAQITGGRQSVARIAGDGRLELQAYPPAAVRALRRVLHPIAHRAQQR